MRHEVGVLDLKLKCKVNLSVGTLSIHSLYCDCEISGTRGMHWFRSLSKKQGGAVFPCGDSRRVLVGYRVRCREQVFRLATDFVLARFYVHNCHREGVTI